METTNIVMYSSIDSPSILGKYFGTSSENTNSSVREEDLIIANTCLDREVIPNLRLPESVQFSRSVMSDSLRPHELQHARPPCPSPTPEVHPNPCPSNR